MALVPFDTTVRDRFGSVKPGARLYLYEQGTTDEVALFADSEGSVALTQPLLSDLEGRYTQDSDSHIFSVAWAAAGLYDQFSPEDTINPTVPALVGWMPGGEVLAYLGTWDPTTNTPTLADGTGIAGDGYMVSADEAAVDLGSGSMAVGVGDFVIYSGSVWEKVSGPILSVGGDETVVGDWTFAPADDPEGRSITSIGLVSGPVNMLDHGDGSTTDWGAIINTLLAAGYRHFYFPPGAYPFTTQIALSGKASVHLEGPGGRTDIYGNVESVVRMPAYLLYKGTGSSSAIKVGNSTSGFHLEGLGVYYDSNSFTGRLIDLDSDVTGCLIEGCDIGGLDRAHASAFCNISVSNSWNNTIRDNMIAGAQWGILGVIDNAIVFSDAIRVLDNDFAFHSVAVFGGVRHMKVRGNFFGMGGTSGLGPSAVPGGTPRIYDTPSTITTNHESNVDWENNDAWDQASDTSWFRTSVHDIANWTFHGNHFKHELTAPLMELNGGQHLRVTYNQYLGDASAAPSLIDLGDVGAGAGVFQTVFIRGNRVDNDTGSPDFVANKTGHKYLDIQSAGDLSFSPDLQTIGPGLPRLGWSGQVPRPTIAAETALGTSPTVGIHGTDIAGWIDLQPGSGATAGKQATITLGTPYLHHPDNDTASALLLVQLTPMANDGADGDNAVDAGAWVRVNTGDDDTWAVYTKNTPVTRCRYFYQVIGK